MAFDEQFKGQVLRQRKGNAKTVPKAIEEESPTKPNSLNATQTAIAKKRTKG